MRRHVPSALVTTLAFSLASVTATFAESPSSPSQPPPPPAESHQFDFWLGEWTVTTPDGKHAGDSKIERIANGFGLLENWTSGSGYAGKSLNAWNAAKKQWQQFWIGSDGGVLELAGGLDGEGRMELSGERPTAAGTVMERITWTPNPDGSVRQLWEQSRDGGKTWSAAFDGHYVKKAKGFTFGGAIGSRAMDYLLQ